MKSTPARPPETPIASPEENGLPASLVCVLTFNASDSSGAGGLTGDIAAISAVGGHPLAVVTGAYARDSSQVFEHFCFDSEAVTEQARAALEDMPVQAIKVGFAGSPENLATIAEIASDYADIPVIAYMPDLAWWQDDLIDQYLDAFAELLLPLTSVLVGNHGLLARWLLPDWAAPTAPSPRELAVAAAEHGVPYLLVTGVPLQDQHIDNVLTSAESVIASMRFERIAATFIGAGDTLSATFTALIASGCDLGQALAEALAYLDGSLENGIHPGMGHALPDRMFWAQPEDADDDDEPLADPLDASGFEIPPHDTQH
ncbi:hydroxymethylpyrimidine/phosphomethylpyrimidine kinase [Melaminivora sp.]